ncbi:MAG: type IV pilus twitching motility protein PilT [Chloroflexota bacterium]
MIEWLREAMACQASDIHLTVESPPVVRVDGQLIRLGDQNLTPKDTEAALAELATPAALKRFAECGDADFSYSSAGFGRFRVNAYRQRGSAALAIRIIPPRVKALGELGLPDAVADLARRGSGLVVVTGPTGSGKSTTLAAMVDLINSETASHVISLEDPIEYLHHHRRSIVHQREVGSDVATFGDGLRSILREDPDVIMIGELRDIDSMATALRAAETGHLVLASMHTSDAVSTIDRIIDYFPPYQQQQARVQLASCLQGIVAQQLLPLAARPGRVAACEILIATPAVRNLIREAKTHQLPSLIQTGGRYGMRQMDASLRELLAAGTIAAEEIPGVRAMLGAAGPGGR